MKYLYVLTSDPSDYYLEEALLSISSLKARMPDGFVTLLTDDVTEKNLTGTRRKILDLVDKCKSITIDGDFDKKARSRWLKTSMRRHIEGDFLYIDCDTVIADDLSDIACTEAESGAVLNSHCLWEDDFYRKEADDLNKKLGFPDPPSRKFFNGGVFFCRDTPRSHAFFDEWHRLWLYSLSKEVAMDQPSLNRANMLFDHILTELDGKWNCQVAYGGLAYLEQAKIIHYFGVGKERKPFLLGNRDVLKRIRENGGVPDDIMESLKTCRTLFHQKTRLVADEAMLRVIDSTLFLTLAKISGTKLFACLEGFCVLMRRARLFFTQVLRR